MNREYSKKEIERILSQEVVIPDIVNERMKDTYRELGIETKVTMKYTKKHRTWAAAALVAVLAIGMSAVTFAANKFLSADLVEKDDKVTYDIHVDRTLDEAHEIEVETTYIPEGYVFGENGGNYGGKWHNYDTGGGITIIPYNAAELDRLERSGNAEFLSYSKDEHVKEIDLDGMKADVFVSDSFYIDSEKTVKSIYLFNEEFGYGVQVWSKSDLPADEIIKVAEGLSVKVLDTVVPYATDAEIAAEKAANNALQDEERERINKGVPNSSIYELGEEVRNPLYDADDPEMASFYDDIRFTVQNVEILDALSDTEYPIENYMDYENSIAPWVNQDGTLKPHDRYRYAAGTDALRANEAVLEQAVKSKYVVVKMKAKNCGTSQSEWNQTSGVEMTPYLTNLVPRGDGSYSYPSEWFSSANEGYQLQWGANDLSSFPVYFDKIYYTEGTDRLKAGFWRPLAAGEELEYTLIYIVDEDQLENMGLWFFSSNNSINSDGGALTLYVKISE